VTAVPGKAAAVAHCSGASLEGGSSRHVTGGRAVVDDISTVREGWRGRRGEARGNKRRILVLAGRRLGDLGRHGELSFRLEGERLCSLALDGLWGEVWRDPKVDATAGLVVSLDVVERVLPVSAGALLRLGRRRGNGPRWERMRTSKESG
jgi:hypothetical protein